MIQPDKSAVLVYDLQSGNYCPDRYDFNALIRNAGTSFFRAIGDGKMLVPLRF